MLKNVLVSLVLIVAITGCCVPLPALGGLDCAKSGICQGVGNYIGEKYTDDVFGWVDRTVNGTGTTNLLNSLLGIIGL